MCVYARDDGLTLGPRKYRISSESDNGECASAKSSSRIGLLLKNNSRLPASFSAGNKKDGRAYCFAKARGASKYSIIVRRYTFCGTGASSSL